MQRQTQPQQKMPKTQTILSKFKELQWYLDQMCNDDFPTIYDKLDRITYWVQKDNITYESRFKIISRLLGEIYTTMHGVEKDTQVLSNELSVLEDNLPLQLLKSKVEQ